MLSTVKLFKALPVDTKDQKVNEDLNKKTIPMGFVFSPEVVANYSDFNELIKLVEKVYGKNGNKLNQSFHKSWNKVKESPIESLVFEQIIHYLTTYGAENLGIYNQESVFIPLEELNVPELSEGIKLVVIKGLTKQELKNKLLTLLGAGIALKEDTIKDIIDVATFVGFNESDIEKVKNKEVKVALYDYLDIVPSDPTEFLRFLVYKSTGSFLLIKNKATITAIKEGNSISIVKYFDKYNEKNGLTQLSKIFYRYKPIFLALRNNTTTKKYINRIRRLAIKNHQPMQEDLLNNITARVKSNNPPTIKEFSNALGGANIFRKIRLAYALKFRTTDADSILYKVRNGKGYVKEFNFDNKAGANKIYEVVLKSIARDLKENIGEKKVFIPDNVKYGLPATEKQFTDNIPAGSFVEIEGDMVIGVHWENQEDYRIDLDLAVTDASGKIGWDSRYRSSDRNILFSGDITDAPKPNGASEFFYLSRDSRGAWNLPLNFYNYDAALDVPYQIIIASERPVNPTSHYMVDPNNIIALCNTNIDVRQKNLGLIVSDENSRRFYFSETAIGGSITSGKSEFEEKARKYLLKTYQDPIVLNDVLALYNINVVNSPEEADIDLSIESLEKDTFIKLLVGEN